MTDSSAIVTMPRARGRVAARLLPAIVLAAACGDAGGPGGGVTILNAPATVIQGDVVRLDALAGRDSTAPITWSVSPAGAALVTPEGRFVGYDPGGVQVIAQMGGSADTTEIEVTARGLSGSFAVVGQGEQQARFNSDLWVHGGVAYTGTWGTRGPTGSAVPGNTLYVWDVTDAANPALTDSVVVDARTVNDVKIRADGALAVITHEGSSDELNGITLLGLSDPPRPTLLSRYTDSLESGVHNVWVEGNYVYAAVDGSSAAAGLRVIDVTDPGAPRLVASFYGGSSFVHDVYVRNGLAFVSHWNAGLVILDVGNGIAGGSPVSPVEVSRLVTAGGQTHNAWYWPAGAYVFVGEEDFGTPGIMHVVDVSDLRQPVEVASFAVSGTTPHNFWLDEANAVLYLAWYSQGLRALDVSGELLGALHRQGRELASTTYSIGGPCPDNGSVGRATCTWAPQVEGGLVYLSDMNTGLWVLRTEF